ncbi:MAG: metallophosphoesterase [Nitrospirae bacterium]|nr:metallophosphoesterase [Nitrospirota bacterium]
MWVAVIVFFASVGILLNLFNIVIRASSIILRKNSIRTILFPQAVSFFITVFFTITLTVYGYFEAQNLQVEKLTVKTSKLPPGVGKLTIAQISDVHLGIIVRENILDKVLKIIIDAKPDLIVSTGDLVDGEVSHITYLTGRLKTVNSRLGKFAVTGNHEFYGGIENTVKFMQDSGFTVLRGEGVNIQNLINIAGIDDSAVKDFEPAENVPKKSVRKIISGLPRNTFTILLNHRPEIDGAALGVFDLMLSGHTHKGQIFPIHIIPNLMYPIDSGYAKLPKGSSMYVSRGAGTAGPPVRFLAPPEVTIIEIVPEKQPQK